ncbi:MAG: hypothetical protein ACJAVA_001924 [Flavobacteriaceae bacterium]|jgi:hypothetical protein
MSAEKIFSPPHPLNTAVLFLVFNRLDTTKQVFQAIRQAKPPRLYVAADGARDGKEAETEKVQSVREYILQNIDWECEVKTLFREENLGCKYAVSRSIDWFFDNEEQGIILEDDCLPSQSFFWFCEELLERYKVDMRVWQISGDNFQNGLVRGDGDYYFSKYNHIWGWASWGTRWKHYDVNMLTFKSFNTSDQISNIFRRNSIQKQWSDIFLKVSNGKIDTWDYQWTYAALANSGLTILPNKNLISNIGFGPDATHTTNLESENSKLPIHEMNYPLIHPSFIIQNVTADEFTESKMFAKKNIFLRIINRISRLLK